MGNRALESLNPKRKEQAKLYRGKYIIAVYDRHDDDTCLGVFDNAEDMARSWGIKLSTVDSELSRIYNNKVSRFGIRTPRGYGNVYFIDYKNVRTSKC